MIVNTTAFVVKYIFFFYSGKKCIGDVHRQREQSNGSGWLVCWLMFGQGDPRGGRMLYALS